MPKFEDMFPNATLEEDYEVDGDTVILVNEGVEDEVNCATCGVPTRFLSLSFQGGFCSSECLNEMWDRYGEALGNSLTAEDDEDWEIPF
jgi:hypothetical protein